MDAIQSCAVKVPRTPVDDDAKDPLVNRSPALGLRRHEAARAGGEGQGEGLDPPGLEGALLSLHPVRQVVISGQLTIKASR